MFGQQVEAQIDGSPTLDVATQTITLNDAIDQGRRRRPAGLHRQGAAPGRCSSRCRSAGSRSVCRSRDHRRGRRGARRARRGRPADPLSRAPSDGRLRSRVCSRTCRSRTEPSSEPISREAPSGAQPAAVRNRRRSSSVVPTHQDARREAVGAQGVGTRVQQPRAVSAVAGHRVDEELVHLAVDPGVGIGVLAGQGGGQTDDAVAARRRPGPGRPPAADG